MKTITIGQSRERRPIRCHHRRGGSDPCILVLGGFHGDEPKSVDIARRLVQVVEALDRRHEVEWLIAPLVNPDGYRRRNRRNARGVDLNRNFPTSNWTSSNRRSRMHGGDAPASEPETRCVMRMVERFAPRRIVTIHSINRHRFCNNVDGPAEELARWLADHNGYPVRHSIGYATPGSFGTWAGVERGIATITLELPSHHSAAQCWRENRDGLLRIGVEPFRSQTEPDVKRMRRGHTV